MANRGLKLPDASKSTLGQFHFIRCGGRFVFATLKGAWGNYPNFTGELIVTYLSDWFIVTPAD
jgi:hypothetical protein